jgi:DNA-binding MarR family transcriptional regulator
MKQLFAGLKKIRDFERLHLPFLKTVVDFDIVVEIGYEEERNTPLTLKRLYLLKLSSRGTVRRRLTRLIDQGIVTRKRHPTDKRASLLVIPAATLKHFSKYSGILTSISGSHFK